MTWFKIVFLSLLYIFYELHMQSRLFALSRTDEDVVVVTSVEHNLVQMTFT